MTPTCTTISPAQTASMVEQGARLIDIREPDEFRRAHAPRSENRPLGQLGDLRGNAPAIFMCRSGMRTQTNAEQLLACCQGPAFILDGGLDAWSKAGLPVSTDRSQPMEIMRQVQIAAGGLVLLGTILGLLLSPAWLALAAIVGGGLVFAGASGWCGMARVLSLMPWNRTAGAA